VALLAVVNRVLFVRKANETETGKALLNLFVKLSRKSRAFFWNIPPEEQEFYTNEVCKGALREKNKQALYQMMLEAFDSRWFNILWFIKNEGTKVVKFSPEYFQFIESIVDCLHPVFPEARVVSPMDRRGNLYCRRFIGPIENRFYNCRLPRFGTPSLDMKCFGKGLNTSDTFALIVRAGSHFADPAYFMMDASRADAHLRTLLHKAKFDLFDMMLDPFGRQLMSRVKKFYYRPKFVRQRGIKFKAGAMLCSGVMDTALANNVCFWICHSLFRMALTNYEHVGDMVREVIPDFPLVPLAPHEFVVLYNGDDCVPIVERGHVEIIQTWVKPFYSLLGVDMKVDGVAYGLEHVEWCQQRPVIFRQHKGCAEGKMVRDPSKIVSTVLSSVKNARLTPIDLKYRLGTIGVCELILNLGIPILQSFSLALIRNGAVGKLLHHDTSGSFYRAVIEMKKFGMSELRVMRPAVISHHARQSFETAYGFTLQQQIYWENYFDNYVLPEDSRHVYFDVTKGFWF